MAHPRAKLTPFGRRLLVERVEVLGWTPAEAANSLGVTRPTVYKWLKRFREEGPAGLEDRSSRPHRSPPSPGSAIRAGDPAGPSADQARTPPPGRCPGSASIHVSTTAEN